MGNSTPSISIHALRGEGDHKGSDKPLGRLAFLSTPSAGRATTPNSRQIRATVYFYPRPPRGGRRANRAATTPMMKNFYPRPPRGGRPPNILFPLSFSYFYPRPPRGGRHGLRCAAASSCGISIHALRGEGDTAPPQTHRRSSGFLSTPSAGRATVSRPRRRSRGNISIHALRGEGDSKNGEKHLRFCFIIKRSAQIWKSLSKNIQKNSCDLHRTA